MYWGSGRNIFLNSYSSNVHVIEPGELNLHPSLESAPTMSHCLQLTLCTQRMAPYYTLIMEAKPTECLFQSVLTPCLQQLFFDFYSRKSSREATGGESAGGGGQTKCVCV